MFTIQINSVELKCLFQLLQIWRLFLWFICSVGIFEWGMLYKEGPLPKKEANKREHFTEPYNSPTHAGGLFAIKRDWFKDLGWYDPGEYMLMLDICCGKSQN